MSRLALLLVLLATPALAADEQPRFRNRATVGVVGGWAGAPGGVGAGALSLAERFRWDAVRTSKLGVDVGFAGRLGVGFYGAPHIDRLRIREARVRVRPGRFTLVLGRDRVLPEFARLLDGAAVQVEVAGGLRVGGWIGEVPDAASTSPLPRFGGGATVSFSHSRVRAAAMVEALGGPGGFDRAALFLSGRWQIVRGTELGGRLELEFPGGAAPRPVEAAVTIRSRLPNEVRVHGFYSLLGTRAARRTPLLDPSGARWQQRLVAAGLADPEAPASDLVDLSAYHGVGGGVRWTPRLPSRARLDLRFDGRARFHAEAKRTGGYLRVGAGVRGLLGGRLGLRIEEVVVVRAEPTGAVADTRLVLNTRPHPRFGLEIGGRLGPRLDAPGARGGFDLFVDVELARGLTLSGGYELAVEPHADGVDQAHTGLVSLSFAFPAAAPEPWVTEAAAEAAEVRRAAREGTRADRVERRERRRDAKAEKRARKRADRAERKDRRKQKRADKRERKRKRKAERERRRQERRAR